MLFEKGVERWIMSKTSMKEKVMQCHQEVSNSENPMPSIWKAILEVRKSQQMILQAGTYSPVGIKFCIQDVNVSLSQGTNFL